MPGSKLSVAGPNTVLNTIVADVLDQFADELEKADNFQDALDDLIKRTIKENQNIIFNGNGYSDEWPVEAEREDFLTLSQLLKLFLHSLHKRMLTYSLSTVFIQKLSFSQELRSSSTSIARRSISRLLQ